MAKIHTHYDNLKVSRKAPQEVIRAAYKALSQKYHPDKNPHDEKAARIMAVVNSAYNALSDPQMRKEHDEWIAAEEWEIEWLESTRAEEGKDKNHDEHHGWAAVRAEAGPAKRIRIARRTALMLACVALGWGGAFAAFTQASWLPALSASFGIGKSAAADAATLAGAAAKAAPAAVKPVAHASVAAPPLPPLKVVALSQIRLFELACDAEPLKTAAGGAWPQQSMYLPDARMGNAGGDTQIVIDNGVNGANVAVQLVDIDRNETVRQAFILAHEKFAMQKLNAGNYEVRFDAVDISAADRAECEARKRRPVAGRP